VWRNGEINDDSDIDEPDMLIPAAAVGLSSFNLILTAM
jgi:hypothetical protein